MLIQLNPEADALPPHAIHGHNYHLINFATELHFEQSPELHDKTCSD